MTRLSSRVCTTRPTRAPLAFATATTCGLLLVLAGCQIPNLRCAEKGAPLPSNFNGVTSAENSANVGIDEFFGDPVLSQLICQGLASNQELKIRNQEIQIAGNAILARRGAYLPFVFFRTEGGVERTSKFTPLGAAEELPFPEGDHFPDPLPNVRLSADLLWRIDIWREFRNARDAAIQRYVKAVESRNYFVTQLVAEIAGNYYELAGLDKQLVILDQTIDLLQRSLDAARALNAAARGTELGVQRFLAEVRKNEAQRFIVRQRIIEVENEINFLVGRYPQSVDRAAWDFINLDSRMLAVGVPAQLLLNRRDIRAAERELAAAGLDVLVARAHFFPTVDITASVGFEAFNPKYLFDPEAIIANFAGDLVAPLINKRAIQAEYMNANAEQLEAVYEYQRTVLNAFTEVVNNLAKVENYRRSVEIKLGQVQALDASVSIARDLFNAPILEEFAKVDYVDVLLATRDLLEARTDLVETKQQQLSAIVNAYQALGGGYLLSSSGKTFAELYCPPTEIQPDDVELPLAPEGLLMPPEAGKATLSPDAAANPLPAPAGQPAPPAFDNASPQQAPGKATISPTPDAQNPPPAGDRSGSPSSAEVMPLFGPYEESQPSTVQGRLPSEIVPFFDPLVSPVVGNW